MRNLNNVLDILQEECAEVIQAVSKIRRFGMDTEWAGYTNKEHLVTEIGDVLTLIKILIEETDININESDVEQAAQRKYHKLNLFLPHDS